MDEVDEQQRRTVHGQIRELLGVLPTLFRLDRHECRPVVDAGNGSRFTWRDAEEVADQDPIRARAVDRVCGVGLRVLHGWGQAALREELLDSHLHELDAYDVGAAVGEEGEIE